MRSRVLLAVFFLCGGGSCREVASDVTLDLSPARDIGPEDGAVEPIICQPSCEAKNCGADDGCDGRCPTGTCADGQRCLAGACVCDGTSCPDGCCGESSCFEGLADDACGGGGAACDDCIAKSQACGADRWCFECQPDCSGKDCGADNGCGGACSTGACSAGLTCSGGQCRCTTDSCFDGCCSADAATCHLGDEQTACGRAGELCQSCLAPDTCIDGACSCVPSTCPSCGIDDGCGTICGCGNDEGCFDGVCEIVACQYCSTPSGACDADCKAMGSTGGVCDNVGSQDPANCCACAPVSSGTASKGVFDSVSSGQVRGWACDPDNPWTSIMVHVYVGGPAGSGASAYPSQASVQSEAAVKAACGSGDYHRFRYTIPAWQAVLGQQVYIYGISVNGGGNSLLAGSPKAVQ